jgi:hypothetical protein
MYYKMTKIISEIEKYGKSYPLEIYNLVKSYNDLLLTNIAFFKNKLASTYNYLDYFISETMEDHNFANFKDDLIELAKYGIYSVNGHSNYCEYLTKDNYELYQKFNKISDDNIQINKKTYKKLQYRQRCYLDFFISQKDASLLIPILKQQNIFMHVIYPDYKISSNVPNLSISYQAIVSTDVPLSDTTFGDKINLSTPNLREITGYDAKMMFPNIYNILKDKVLIFLYGKEMCKDDCIELLLNLCKQNLSQKIKI